MELMIERFFHERELRRSLCESLFSFATSHQSLFCGSISELEDLHFFPPIGLTLINSPRLITSVGVRRFRISSEVYSCPIASSSVLAYPQYRIENLKRGENMYLPREEGQGLVEYALILVLVAIVVIAILLLVGPQIANIFSKVTNGLSAT
jgi:pilus assembly protein Flp/PilA